MSRSNEPDREAILVAARRVLLDGQHQHTTFAALATIAGVGLPQLHSEFEDWPQVALAAFISVVARGRESTGARPLPDSPLERVLNAAEELVLAAAAHRPLLRTAMQAPSAIVWEELSGLFGPDGPLSQMLEDLTLADAAGEIPAGTADAAQRVIISSVLGLVLGQVDGLEDHGQRSWDLMQGTLLFGLGDLATLPHLH